MIATGFAVVLVAQAALKAEQIQFSKPAMEIAAPSKAEENLPETRSKRLDFSAPEVARPIIPQQTIIRIQPREEDEDDRFSPRDSSRPTDPRRRKDPASARNSLAPRETYPGELWRGEPPGFRRPDSQRALSPVMDFDWDARESATYQGGSALENRSSGERDVARKRGAPANRDQYGVQNEVLPSSPFSDIFTSRPKEKPSRELLERRAAFEQMLNPGVGIAGRTPGSLEPVPALDVPKSAPSLVMPAIGGAALNPKSADPMQAFNVHERLRGPMLEDIHKRYSAPSASASSTAIDSRLQTPLNRQPTARDFPTRRF